MRKSAADTISPLHDFHTSYFTYVMRCIIAFYCEPSLFPAIEGTVTGNLPMSRHPFEDG